VAFDDTRASWFALRAGAQFARVFGADLTVLHAVQPRFSSFDRAAEIAQAKKSARRGALALFARVRQRVGTDVSLTTEVVTGDPVDAISRRAAELAADLIVVGSNQRGALDRLLVGSVSEGIMRRAETPVLVVPILERTATGKAEVDKADQASLDSFPTSNAPAWTRVSAATDHGGPATA
jgi:nucleotide-binding universal stress UspA family protein